MSKKSGKDPTTLNFMQQKFVNEYLSGKSAKASAIAAGYSETSAHVIANDLLHKHPGVMAQVGKVRKELEAKGLYNLEIAMREADEAIQFAKETENANAYVKALELKSKLNGLLVEKHEVKQVGFQILIKGIDDVLPEKPVEEIHQLETGEQDGD